MRGGIDSLANLPNITNRLMLIFRVNPSDTFAKAFYDSISEMQLYAPIELIDLVRLLEKFLNDVLRDYSYGYYPG